MRNYSALTRSLGLISLTALAACNAPPIIDPMTAKPPTTPAAPMACSMLPQGFEARGVERNVSITAAESVPAGITVNGMAEAYPMPAHCKLTGKVGERTGTDGKPYAISFELRMPNNWQGRFLLQANGGNEGAVVPAFGNVVAAGATTNALMQGFAVLSSNGGHASLPPQTPGADGKPVALVGGNLFGLDDQARRDYGYQSTAVMVPLARQIIATHYGEPVRKSYMMGCSNGGRHGMVAAARFPDLFDGIIAGNPGFNLPKAAVQHAWDIQAFSAVNPDIKEAFPPADMQLLANTVLDKCDMLDGAKDGMIGNLSACQKAFDVQTLQCKAEKNASCLSAPQVTALKKVFGGPRNSKGEQLYSDWPWDAGVGASQIGFGSWRAWKLEGPKVPTANLPIIGVMGAGSLAYIFSTPPKPVAGTPPALLESLRRFDFDRDAPAIFATAPGFSESSIQFMTPPNATDLSAFKARGGKLVVYHGNSDPVFSVNDSINWYQGLDKNQSGRAKDFARLITIPGLNHCQGGPTTEQFDLLTATVNWVEKGQAPDTVIATARTGINPDVPKDWVKDSKPRTRPLCSYPAQPRYRGTGDINDAASFVCE